MLAIAFSLFARSHLPWNRKAILCGIFSLGIFVILAAILNKYYSFTHPFGTQWTYWYVRESSTAILVSNLPFIWTLLRRMFNLKSFDHGGGASEIPWHSSRSAMGRNPAAHPGRTATTLSQKPGSSSPPTKAMSETGSGAPGFPPKHDSQSSKGSDDVEWGVRVPAAEGLAAPPRSARRPPPAPWRNRSVYGRADLEVMSVDPWDYGAGGGLGGADPLRPVRAPVAPPSPVDHRRRIKGQQEMSKLQEGLTYKYNGIDDVP